MDRSRMTGKILRLTLKIIYLLTGEDYVPIKRSEEDDIAAPVPLSYDTVNDEKILELTNRIIELLTGEGEHLTEVKDEPMSSTEDSSDVHAWAMLKCKEEEIPMFISADPFCQTNSQEHGRSISVVDGSRCKEEAITADISAGKSKLNHMHRGNRELVDATHSIAAVPVAHRVDPSETMNTRLNIVVIDADEGDLQFKEEEEEIPIVPRLEGSKNKLQKPSRPCNSVEQIQNEDMESDDTETDEDEDDSVSGLKIVVKSEEAETRIKIKKEAFTADISRGCTRSCSEHRTTKPDTGTSTAVDQKILPINRRLVTAEKPFFCADCGGFFKHKSSLVLHRRIHSGEKPFTCSQCGKEFIQKANYIRHQRLHTGEKPYKCTECGKLYAQKQSLIMHQKFHAENEPFACPECGESFIRQSHLVNHRKTHKGLKRYSCPDCGDFFMLRSSLVIHQRVHSAERPLTG